MDTQRIEACNKIIRHIKNDLNRIKDYSPLQGKIFKSEYCIRLILDIESNLRRLYTFDEIEYVRNSLGKNTWETMLYYLNKHKTLNNPENYSI